MAKYKYEALKDNKDLVNGYVEAVTPRDAREKVRALGLMPIKVFEEKLITYELSDIADNRGSVKFLSLSEKMMLVSELHTMLGASISVVEALQTIQNHTPKMKVKRFAKEIQDAILQGKSFSEAINYLNHDVFGDTFINLCAAGENSGELDQTLGRMLVLLKKQDNIKGNVIRALIYPCILILMMFGLLVFFSLVVFPVFTSFVMNQGGEIPTFAKMVTGTLSFIGNYWWFCLLLILASIGGVIFLATNEYSRTFFDKLLLKIPLIQEFVNYINLSNYMCILSISYATGVPFLKGLNLASATVKNTEVRKKADFVYELMGKGTTLSDAMEKSHLLPGALVTMVAAGEKSGNLSKMLEDCVEVIDKKIDMVLQSLAKAFEPAMIIVLGIIVLIIAVAFMQMYIAMILSIG